jgi:hypothetical protein
MDLEEAARIAAGVRIDKEKGKKKAKTGKLRKIKPGPDPLPSVDGSDKKKRKRKDGILLMNRTQRKRLRELGMEPETYKVD